MAVDCDEKYFDQEDRFDLLAPGLICYNHGSYEEAGKVLGTFGYSVRKKPAGKKPGKTKRH